MRTSNGSLSLFCVLCIVKPLGAFEKCTRQSEKLEKKIFGCRTLGGGGLLIWSASKGERSLIWVVFGCFRMREMIPLESTDTHRNAV